MNYNINKIEKKLNNNKVTSKMLAKIVTDYITRDREMMLNNNEPKVVRPEFMNELFGEPIKTKCNY